MQLTHYTDYSLRVLIFLTLQDDQRLVTINEIAEHFSIARNHLIKVVQRLGQLGYVKTVRGKGGGIRIGRPAETIVIGQVVRDMEANLEIINCNKPPCPLTGNCQLKGILNEASEAFFAVLARYTLAELKQQPQQIQNLLHWPPRAAKAD